MSLALSLELSLLNSLELSLLNSLELCVCVFLFLSASLEADATLLLVNMLRGDLVKEVEAALRADLPCVFHCTQRITSTHSVPR
jgi:hypothetical protein